MTNRKTGCSHIETITGTTFLYKGRSPKLISGRAHHHDVTPPSAILFFFFLLDMQGERCFLQWAKAGFLFSNKVKHPFCFVHWLLKEYAMYRLKNSYNGTVVILGWSCRARGHCSSRVASLPSFLLVPMAPSVPCCSSRLIKGACLLCNCESFPCYLGCAPMGHSFSWQQCWEWGWRETIESPGQWILPLLPCCFGQCEYTAPNPVHSFSTSLCIYLQSSTGTPGWYMEDQVSERWLAHPFLNLQ